MKNQNSVTRENALEATPMQAGVNDSARSNRDETMETSTGRQAPHEAEFQNEIDKQKYWRATVALCLSNFTQSYLLISVFPYAGFMAMDLVPSVTEENAGRYAGLIASVFMVGRALCSYPWGKFADSYGRKPVLLISLFWSALASIAFGLSKSFSMALVSRFLLGLNGIISTVKTLGSELAKGDRQLETKGMGILLGMWGWGFLFGPAVSGSVAEPLKQYPHLFEHWDQQTWMYRFLERFPFFWPNLVAFLLCAVSFVLVLLNVEETLPSRRELKHFFFDVCQHMEKMGGRMLRNFRKTVHCMTSASRNSNELLPILRQTHADVTISNRYGLVDSNDKTASSSSSSSSPSSVTMSTIWNRPSTRRLLIVYWTASFMIVCIDEGFPLFCISKVGGMGLSESSIGQVLSGAGLLFALGQYPLYGTLTLCCGLHKAIQLCLFILVPLIAIIPLSVVLNSRSSNSGGGSLSWNTFLYLIVVTSALRMFFLTFVSAIAVATNHSVPSHYRATMNGLSMLGGSIAKGLGPIFAGYLVTFCLNSGVVPPAMGPYAVFGILSAIMLAIALFSHRVLSAGGGEKDVEVHEDVEVLAAKDQSAEEERSAVC